MIHKLNIKKRVIPTPIIIIDRLEIKKFKNLNFKRKRLIYCQNKQETIHFTKHHRLQQVK